MSNTGTLKRIEPLHPPIVPPQGAVPAGITADGQRQLWSLKRPRSRSIPRLTPEGDRLMAGVRQRYTGEDLKFQESLIRREHQQQRLHATTGEPMYKLRKGELYEEDLLFTLESQGNGNIEMIHYHRPTEKELADERRRVAIAEMSARLPEILVDRGINLDALASLLQPTAAAPTVVPVVEAPVAEPAQSAEPAVIDTPVTAADLGLTATFPSPIGGGWYRLSDGTKVQGSKGDAVKAEAVVKEKMAADALEQAARAKDDAAASPEV